MKSIKVKLVCGLALAAASFSLKADNSVRDYVQEGLICQWDGIVNQRTGVHQANATTWQDIAPGADGTYDLTVDAYHTDNKNKLIGGEFEANCLRFDGYAAHCEAATPAYETIEIVFASTSDSDNRTIFSSGLRERGVYVDNASSVVFFDSNWSVALQGITTGYIANEIRCCSCVYGRYAGMVQSVYNEGAKYSGIKKQVSWHPVSDHGVSIGNTDPTDGQYTYNAGHGRIYAIRIYNRRLSGAEIAANHAIDIARFKNSGHILDATELMMSGVPCEVPTEAAGVYGARNFAAGETATLQNPSPDCTGWYITDAVGNRLSSGTGASCEYTHPDPAAYRRLYWTYRTVEGDFAGSKVYVSPDGHDDDTGADWEHAIRSVTNAVARISEGGRVYLASGCYEFSNGLELTGGRSLYGCGLKNADVELQLYAAGGAAVIALKIDSSADTVVTNLTVSNGRGTNSHGVRMNSGTLVDCRVADCSTVNNKFNGAGIYLDHGGFVSFCDITNCFCQSSGGGSKYGGGVYFDAGGRVENCRIIRCSSRESGKTNPAAGGGAYLNGGGILRNCLIEKCDSPRGGSGVMINSAGVVENCTIACNTQSTSESTSSGVAITTGGNSFTFRNNIVWGNTAYDGETVRDIALTVNDNRLNLISNNVCSVNLGAEYGNLTDNPNFVDEANGDYHLLYGYIVDKGAEQPWMAEAVDLDGNPRVHGVAVDPGCYEFTPSGSLSCYFRVIDSGTVGEREISFESSIVGEAEGAVFYWTLTRHDGTVIAVSGADKNQITEFLTVGVWDARLDVTNGAGNACSAFTAGAVDIRVPAAYVSATSQNPVYPYTSLETAANNIADAFPLLGNGGTLYIDEGVYDLYDCLELVDGKCSRVVGFKGPENTILRQMNCANFAGNVYPTVRMTKGDARLEGVTLVGGYSGPYNAGSTFISRQHVVLNSGGAVVTNCVFRDLQGPNGYGGCGVELRSGTLADSKFTRIVGEVSGGGSPAGGILLQTGGLADRITLDDCWVKGGCSGNGAGDLIRVEENGEIRNSMIVRCHSADDALVAIFGKMDNCTIACCTNGRTTTGTRLDRGGSGVSNPYLFTALYVSPNGKVRNSLVADNWSIGAGYVTNVYVHTGGQFTCSLTNDSLLEGEGNLCADPRFKRDMRNGNLLTGPGSPCINAGIVLEWMDDGSRDVFGNRRIIGRPDIGAYENCAEGLMIYLR